MISIVMVYTNPVPEKEPNTLGLSSKVKRKLEKACLIGLSYQRNAYLLSIITLKLVCRNHKEVELQLYLRNNCE